MMKNATVDYQNDLNAPGTHTGPVANLMWLAPNDLTNNVQGLITQYNAAYIPQLTPEPAHWNHSSVSLGLGRS